MGVSSLLTRPCTILHATAAADTYDQALGTPTSETTVCELQQAVSTEAGEGAIQETTWRAFLPATASLTGSDALMVDSIRYELVGDAWPVWDPDARAVSHVEAQVKRVQ